LRSAERTRCDRAAFRFPFAASESAEGGLDELVESRSSRARRAATSASNTPIRASARSSRAPARSSRAVSSTTSVASSSYDGPGWTPRHDLLPSRLDQVSHAGTTVRVSTLGRSRPRPLRQQLTAMVVRRRTFLRGMFMPSGYIA
jgi:hypothetical protein